MKVYEEEGILSHRIIPGCTPDYVISHLSQQPLIVHHWKKNTEENQKGLIDALMRLPTPADCPGYIYGFRDKSTYNSSDRSYWIKMGRTKRSVPQDRIKEWEKTDKHQYNQIFTVRSQYNNKLQLLVHLIFAYARKPIKINDQLRIQWFQFDQKVPTAAITNLTNLLMEKIHEKYIDKISIQDEKTFPAYDNIIQTLSQKEKLKKEQFSIVAFGLPKTGKTIFGNIINGDEILGESSESGIKLKVNPKKQRSQHYFQISDPRPFKNEEEALMTYFSFWKQLCSSKTILPLLFVKLSDIQSSKMIGLIEGLNLIEKYIKIPDSLKIIITYSRKKITFKEVRKYIQQNKEFLTENQFKMLLNSECFFINEAEEKGPIISSSQQNLLTKTIEIWCDNIKKSKEEGCQIQFKMDQKYLNICHQVIQKSYKLLQPSYSDQFPLRYSEYLEESLQDNFVRELGVCIQKFKSNQSQTSAHQVVQRICQLLQLKPVLQIQSFLYVFCQICTNKNLQHSEIMSQLHERVHQKIIQVIDKQTSKLVNHLQDFRKVIGLYGKKDDDIVAALMKVIDQTKLEKMINILIKIIEISKGKTIQGISSFIKTTEKIVQVLGEIDDKMKRGYRLDSVFGKVRQTIYYGLKGQVKEQSQEKAVEINEQINFSKEILQSTFKRTEIGDLKTLNKTIDDYPLGETVVNITKVFSISPPPKTQSIKHNLIILAKQIKIYDNLNISFKTVKDSQNEKTKINIVFVAETWANINKLDIPHRSPNGKGLCLTLQDGQFKNIKPETKSDLFDKKEVMESLKKLYESSFK